MANSENTGIDERFPIQWFSIANPMVFDSKING